MSKPTPAQIEYLRNALKVADAGTGRRNFFQMNGPGHQRTGNACYLCDWIIGSGISWGMYSITPAGRAVLEAVG